MKKKKNYKKILIAKLIIKFVKLSLLKFFNIFELCSTGVPKQGAQILMGCGPLASQDKTYPDEKYSPIRHEKKSKELKLSALSLKIYWLTNSRTRLYRLKTEIAQEKLFFFG